METDYIIMFVVTGVLITASILINSSFHSKTRNKTIPRLPPSPFTLPIIGKMQYFQKSFLDLEPSLRKLYAKRGRLVSLPVGSDSSIVFINSHYLAHQTLVRDGAIFAGRPKDLSIGRISINSSTYGPTWRCLRRNHAAEILHPLRLKSHSGSRRRVQCILVDILEAESKSGSPVLVEDHLRVRQIFLAVLHVLRQRGFWGTLNLIRRRSKEIKMMPFGAGRRVCPVYEVAVRHLEYFLANLVWKFQWNAVDHVDLSEEEEFTVVMKHPLLFRLARRLKCPLGQPQV